MQDDKRCKFNSMPPAKLSPCMYPIAHSDSTLNVPPTTDIKLQCTHCIMKFVVAHLVRAAPRYVPSAHTIRNLVHLRNPRLALGNILATAWSFGCTAHSHREVCAQLAHTARHLCPDIVAEWYAWASLNEPEQPLQVAADG